MPEALSVINRSVLIPAKNEYRQGNQDSLSYLNTISIIDSWREVTKNIDVQLMRRERTAINESIELNTGVSRLDDTYRTIILINRLYEVVNEEELIKSIKYVIKRHTRYMTAMDEEIKMISSAMSWALQTYRQFDVRVEKDTS